MSIEFDGAGIPKCPVRSSISAVVVPAKVLTFEKLARRHHE